MLPARRGRAARRRRRDAARDADLRQRRRGSRAGATASSASVVGTRRRRRRRAARDHGAQGAVLRRRRASVARLLADRHVSNGDRRRRDRVRLDGGKFERAGRDRRLRLGTDSKAARLRTDHRQARHAHVRAARRGLRGPHDVVFGQTRGRGGFAIPRRPDAVQARLRFERRVRGPATEVRRHLARARSPRGYFSDESRPRRFRGGCVAANAAATWICPRRRLGRRGYVEMSAETAGTPRP